MRAIELIAKKRDRGALTPDEIAYLIDGYTVGRISDGQMGAFLMAVVLNGMDEAETTALTDAMLTSGAVLDLTDLGRPVGDKHSTGGVGDKTSLVIAPIAAEAGLTVPMISGRALGHTGGTLDKLEAIPGFRTDLSLAAFRRVLADHGAGFIGQTPEIAPADRELYALRGATGTVPSVPLIVGSIMSKKLAEGLDVLVLDVKFGRGAFMKTQDRASELARAMCAVGARHGTRVEALLTRMDDPLGRAVGNAVEVRECVDVLRGNGPEDVAELSIELAARMIALAGIEPDVAAARRAARGALESGAALERLKKIVEAQGGDPRAIDDTSRLPNAPVERVVESPGPGFVVAIHAEEIGWAVMGLGAGRASIGGAVDAGVGLVAETRVGDEVGAGDPLCRIFARDEASADRAAARAGRAYSIGAAPPPRHAIIAATLVEGAHA